MNHSYRAFFTVGMTVFGFFFSAVSFGGQARYVGPGQAFQDIQSAINVSTSGDVILVDPQPTPYPPFTVLAAGISIVSSQGSTQKYSVGAVSGVPAIEVRLTPFLESVTIMDADVIAAAGSAPAILVSSNIGIVRFNEVRVQAPSTGAGGPAAFVQVESSPVWFSHFDAAFTLAATAANSLDGISALALNQSDALIQSSTFRGTNAPTGTGGHGVTMTGGSLDIYGLDLGPTYLGGGDGLVGGHGLHKQSGPALGCAKKDFFLVLDGGRGRSQQAWGYWIPGNSGAGVQPSLSACLADIGIAEVNVPDRFSIGSPLLPDLKSTAPLGFRHSQYWLLEGAPGLIKTRFSPNGKFWIEPLLPFGALISGLGSLPSSGVASFAGGIPAHTSLIGYQATFQGALLAASNTGTGGALAISEPRMAVVLP